MTVSMKLRAIEPVPMIGTVDLENFPKPKPLITNPINGISGTSQINCVNTIKKGLFKRRQM